MQRHKPTRRGEPKTYRFGLYGRSGAGKTCILAALAMKRRPHPLNFTATRLYAQYGAAGNVAHARGDEWLDEAIRRLEHGEVPPPNPQEDPDDNQREVRFEFTTPEPRRYRVAISDYSGELADARAQGNEDSLAAKLRRHMEDIDALLVIASAPSATGNAGQASDDVKMLREAFASISDRNGPVIQTPVAMIVSKWDRRGALTDRPLDDECAALNAILDKDEWPEHTALRDKIAGSVVRGSFACFPGSAFGEAACETRPDGTAVELPRRWGEQALPSFALEDPFVWLARRRDAVDLANYECDVEPLRPRTALGRWFGYPHKAARLKSRGAEIASRFPPDSSEHQAARRLAKTCFRVAVCRAVTIVLSALALWLLSEATVDEFNSNKAQLIVAKADSTTQMLDWASGWLDAYHNSPSLRHVVLPIVGLTRRRAAEMSQEIAAKRDDREWAALENAAYPSSLLLAYLASFPEGRHVSAAKAKVAESKMQHEIADNLSALDAIEQDATAVSDPEKLKKLLSRAREPLRYQDSATSEQLARKTRLTNKISGALERAIATVEWNEFLNAFREHLEAERFSLAARLFTERAGQPKPQNDLPTIEAELQAALTDKLAIWANRLAASRRFDDAYTELDRLSSIRFADKRLAAAVESCLTQLALRHDEGLYGDLRKYRDHAHAKIYLNERRIPHTMRREVSDFANYLEQWQCELPLELVLASVSWGNDCQSANDNEITVTVSNERAIQEVNVSSAPLTRTGQIGTAFGFKAKPSGSIVIHMMIVEKDLIYDDDQGQGQATVPLKEFRGGYLLHLHGDGMRNSAVFRVKGLPDEPPLPKWRSKK